SPDALGGHLGPLLVEGLEVLARLAVEADVVDADVEGAAVDLFDAAAVVAEVDVLALGLLHALLVRGSGRIAHCSIVLRARWGDDRVDEQLDASGCWSVPTDFPTPGEHNPVLRIEALPAPRGADHGEGPEGR